MLSKKTYIRRFWNRVNKTATCWLWIGPVMPGKRPYGLTQWNNIKLAHRISVWLDGRDPIGKVVRHTCDNPRCVNPQHLIVGTQRENVADMYQRNRANDVKGSQHPKHILVDQQVIDIRNSNLTPKQLAKQYNVSRDTIYSIKNYKTWRHI